MRRIVYLLLLCVVPSIAQQQPTGAAKQTSSKGRAQSSESFTVDGVVDLVQAGLSDDLIIVSLRKEGKSFDLGPADLIRLKKANVSENVIKVMLDPKAEIKPPAPAPVQSPPTVAQPPQRIPPVAQAQPPPVAPPAPALTAASVQVAVNQAIDWTRKGGSVTVSGVQEFPGQNEARADLQFNLQYNADFMGIPRQKNETTPPGNPAVVYIPPSATRSVANYSGPGAATIKHYSDGRWVLTQIDFNFKQLTMNIQIPSSQTAQSSPTDFGVPPAQPSPPNSVPSPGPSISMAGKWTGQLVDGQGTYPITLTLRDTGRGAGTVSVTPARGATKTFDLAAVLKAQGNSVSGTLEYKYKVTFITCNATMSVSAQLDGQDHLSGTYAAKSSCEPSQTGKISLQRN